VPTNVQVLSEVAFSYSDRSFFAKVAEFWDADKVSEFTDSESEFVNSMGVFESPFLTTLE
jgi:hypothetical protein